MIRWLLRLVPFPCAHQSTYRERRKLHGLMVIHFVCEDCGHAEPVIERSAKEHKQAVKVGATKPLKAQKQDQPSVRRFPEKVAK